jgi:Rrf2 family protein
MPKTPRGRKAVDAGRPLLYSKTCQLAMRVMERVAAAEKKTPDAWVPQADLAKELSVSPPSVAQIVFRLRRTGLLSARRGPSGGVGLARPADEIRVSEVVAAIDGAGLAGRCVLGFEECTSEAPCPAHPVWSAVRPILERELEQRTLLDLVKTVEGKKRLRRSRS